MRDPSESDVLAPLERDLRGDPVLDELTARLARSGRGRRRPTSPAHVLLVAGLALMVLGCVAVSVPVACAGIGTALVALVAAAWPRRR